MVSLRSWSILLAAVVGSATADVGQKPLWTTSEAGPETGKPASFPKRVDEYIEKLMNHYHVPGMSIGVVHGEKTFSKASCISSIGIIEAGGGDFY
jgi:hypothetical protein